MPFSVILTEKGGATQRLDFESEEITIGRVDENDICLPKGNISKKHTKIVVKDGKIIVLDLKSTNGTYVNGKKLAGPQVISPSDKVYVGDFILSVEPPEMAGGEEAPQGEDGEAPTMTPQFMEHPGDEQTDQPAYAGAEATRRAEMPEEPEELPEAEAPPDEEESIPTPAATKKPMRIPPPPPAAKTAPPPPRPAAKPVTRPPP